MDTRDFQPPFPILDSGGLGTLQLRDAGMSLRDYFAAKALTGLTSDSTCNDVLTALDYIAETTYKMADAMMKARAES